MADEALLARVRLLLSEGRLPDYAASRILARYGDCSLCEVCGRPMQAHDVMYELHFGGGKSLQVLKAHLRCFLIWERALAS